MAIAFVRAAEINPTVAATSHSVSFNASGVDCIVVGCRDTGTTSLITGVSFNGVAMTLARHDGTSARGSTIYVLFAPAQVTANIVVSYSTSIQIGTLISGFSGGTFTLGNTSGRSDASASGSGSAVNVPITCLSGSTAVDFFVLTKGDSTAAPTPTAGQTGVGSHLDGGGFAYNRMSYELDSTGVSWVWGGPAVQPQSHSVIELRATAGAATVTGVTVSPSTATVSGGATQTFSATVAGTGGPSQAVNWSTTAGSITSGGVFTAPAATGSVQTVTVTATSVADGAFSGAATVSVPATATVTGVTVSPSTATVVGGAGQTFTATVAGTNSPSQAVNWTTSAGTINSGGVFTAPAATGSVQTITVTATSVLNGAFAGTATVTVPISTSPVLSANFLSVYGRSFKYEDRVKDTASAASGSSITLSGSAPTGFKAFAASFAVGSAGIPVLCEDASGNWMVALCTLSTSTNLVVNSVTSSSNSGSAPTFDGGTKAVYCVVPAAAVKRFYSKSQIDLRDYDVDPTFTNDSTAGIQQAINDAYLSGIQRILVPTGHYKIAGDRVTTDAFGRPTNGQLYIPASPYDTGMKSIQIIGESQASWHYGGINDEPIVEGGTIFESTLTSGGGDRPAVIAASFGYSGGFGNFNFTDVVIENLCIRTSTLSGANKMGGLNLYWLSNGGFLDNVKVEVNRGLATNPDPTGIGSIGIITAATNNSGAFKWGKVFVGGYETAVRFYEHMCIDRLTVYGCVNAVDLQDTNHASSINHLNVENCVNSIVINGDHDLAILCYATEHKGVSRWQDTDYDIKYVTGARKVAILQSTVIAAGSGVSDAGWLTNDGGAHYKVVVGAGAN